MAMHLEQVVPFGRSLDEYVRMFALTQADAHKTILGIADGPASFNAEATLQGYQITSIDPLYRFTAAQIRSRFAQVVDNIIQQVKESPDDWIWDYHGSPDGLRQHREQAIERFCQDYDAGRAAGRYAIGELPQLNFPDRAFELGLCSHFLFLYSDRFDTAFHQRAIAELLRVCQEVRIFPLLTLMRTRSPHLDPVLSQLTERGYQWQIQTVAYELQRGGNEMLKITLL